LFAYSEPDLLIAADFFTILKVRNDAKLIQDGVIAVLGDQESKNVCRLFSGDNLEGSLISPQDFNHRVEMIKKSYSNLVEALSFYATKINNSDAKK
jgi:hypothetical protein